MDKVKLVVVGLNFGKAICEQILRGPGSPFLELAGVCDVDAARVEAAGRELGVRAYASLEQVLADPRVEAVGLFTKPAGRAELVRAVIRAGKHVLTTKPFEISSEAARDVLVEARQLGRIVAINSPSATLTPDLAQVAKWRDEFDLGRPVGARFDVWGNYFETADGSWYDDPALCPVAPIYRIGIYTINDAVRLFGKAARIQVISSRIRTGRPTPDNAQLSILFESGAIASIFASFCVGDGDSYRNAMTLNFERGTVYRNIGAVQPTSHLGGSEMGLVMMVDGVRAVKAQAVLSGFNPHHAYQWDIFQRLVRGDQTPDLITPDEVAAGIRITEAVAVAQFAGGVADIK
ncbi:MAG: Gfo/Idh/MocA family oxidoreductase [Capsulimonadaceae bacterium]|nr:Gfo/Idh/MocA family oxidoreductase [Capsulimonadaceae bacterium]